jgi:nitroreductase
MRDILELMQQRHSERAAYDSDRRITDLELRRLLDAARWAPTAHNMQDFEVVLVDDPAVLTEIGAIRRSVSSVFLQENYQQLSFSEEELLRRKTGVLASMFPPAWRTPDASAAAAEPGWLRDALRGCPALLIVLYDPRRRAPASEGDVLGIMSLGCVMQNIWLAAEDLGLGMQILSAFAAEPVERELRRILALPPVLKIAFACRVGHAAAAAAPGTPGPRYLRVRREIGDFAHRNRYGAQLELGAVS